MPPTVQWTTVRAVHEMPSYSVFTGSDIEKGDLDDRDYRLMRLENGLHVILVHDASSDKAAASLTVQVGAMHDPESWPGSHGADNAQGMAHFCEHMISKGSEVFREENDFLSFISTNGGIRNAATAPSHTYYWFSVGSAFLAGGLARTATFFHSPLFTESLTKREINAVDSEYRRNVQNDTRRVYHITKILSLPGHPYAHFSTGNVDSITERARASRHTSNNTTGESTDDTRIWKETRRELVGWWEQHYCAGRMTLAVLGRESLDELARMVVPLFSLIQNRGLEPRPMIIQPLWGSSEMGSIIFIKTVKDYYGFSLTFLIPDQRPHYKVQPAAVVTHFLGHEGPGSVCAYLKRKAWIFSLTASLNSRNSSVQYLKVEGRLTKDGYAHYGDVLLAIYGYLNMLRSSPLDEYHFKEISSMSKIRFRFQEKSQPHTYVNWLSYQLSEEYPPELILSGDSIIREWDEVLVRKTLEVLRPENGRVTLEAREHAEEIIGKDAQWCTEKWYGTRYCVQRIDSSLMDKAQQPNENLELFLPRPNPYVPADLNVERKDVSEPAKMPVCIHRTNISTLWHKRDDQFWVPKAFVRVAIKSPLAYATPRSAVMSRLIADLVEDALSEVAYDAELAGLAYSVSNNRKGFLISASGFNDKLPALLMTVLHTLKDLAVDPVRLKVVAEQVERGYRNFYLGQPSNLSEEFAAWSLMPTVWTPMDRLDELRFIRAEEVQFYKDELMAKVQIEMLVNGNYSQQQVTGIMKRVEECISPRPLLPMELSQERSLILPEGSNFVLRKVHSNLQEENSSLSYYCQFGEVGGDALRPVLLFIAHIIKEPTHSQLRTREQLGYVVASSSWTVASSMGLGIKVQSTRAPWDVEERVNSFLDSYRDVLAGMSPNEFELQKEGLVVKMMEKVKNLAEETSRFWNHISSGYYDFLRHEKDANAVRVLRIDDVLAAYDQFIRPSTDPCTRKKLSVHLLSEQLKSEEPQISPKVSLLTDSALWTFKAKLTCYPAAVPVGLQLDSDGVPMREKAML
ncbi:LuxS/MPP-like metallohydrolase [Laetiporus sulphureus 93-53]|uniref:LuxS/MPP-like metallohydrolase n=1 Tax=Laetiporus sulphureus 93-53 TaxID=1314785 RepID=A0A165HWU1_9APHY|nr:LuxS/MPP-like metallohydrolase [Laetiporus sulphureus 93-53]KZT12293.1 LuxS/MPP-like metallohydrolase [Laetiporus sulphureus 93-53]